MANGGSQPQPPAEYPYEIPDDLRKPKYANGVFIWCNTALPREIVFDFSFYTPDGTRKPTIVSRVVMSREAAFELSVNLQGVLKMYDQLRRGDPGTSPPGLGRR